MVANFNGSIAHLISETEHHFIEFSAYFLFRSFPSFCSIAFVFVPFFTENAKLFRHKYFA